MKTRLLLLFFFLYFLFPQFAGAEDQVENKNEEESLTPDQKLLDDLRKSLFTERDLLEKYFQKGFLNKVDKMFKDSIKDIHSSDPNPQLTDSFNDFRDSLKAMQDIGHGLSHGLEAKWKESKEGMILTLDGIDAKDGKLDIKVSKGLVSIKAKINKVMGSFGKTTMNYQQTFPVPKGTDANRMQLLEHRDSKGKGIKVLFPWKKGKKPGLTPVSKDKDDVTI